MTVHHLKETSAHDRILREQLIARFGEALADDETALIDTLDGLSDFTDQALAVLRSVDDDELLAEAAKERARQLTERAARLLDRAQTKRAAIQEAMMETGRKRLELPDATISLTNRPPSVMVTDEAKIPAAFFVTPPPKLDKKALKDALKNGDVPGACLSNGGQSLTIRRG